MPNCRAMAEEDRSLWDSYEKAPRVISILYGLTVKYRRPSQMKDHGAA